MDIQRLSDSSLLVFLQQVNLKMRACGGSVYLEGISCENEILAKTARTSRFLLFCFVCGRVFLLLADDIPALTAHSPAHFPC